MSIKSILNHGILTLAFAATGAGVMGFAQNLVETTPEPYTASENDSTFVKYQDQLAKIEKRQKALEGSTDEEGADAHENRKRVFISDSLVDENLSEKQLISLAVPFNKLGTEDGIVFRAFTANKDSMAKRNECLATTPENDTNSVAAQRVENCMEALISQHKPNVEFAAGMGGALGLGFYGVFAMAQRRRAISPA